MPCLLDIGLQLGYRESSCHAGYIVAAVDELGEGGFPALEHHIVVTIFRGLLGFPVHDPECHQFHAPLHSVAKGQFRHTDTAVLANIVEENGRHHSIVLDAHTDGIAGHGQRMNNIGLAALSQLAAVLFPGIGKGLEGLLHARPGGKLFDISKHFFMIVNGDAHFSLSSS